MSTFPDFNYDIFCQNIRQIVTISNGIGDDWTLHEKADAINGLYMVKRISQELKKEIGDQLTTLFATFEYHVTYNISYGVPVLSFVATKQDGTTLRLEEYAEFSNKFGDESLLSTISELDHPVLNRPFLTLHPCRTEAIMKPFLDKSKNPVISWMTALRSYIDLFPDKDSLATYLLALT